MQGHWETIFPHLFRRVKPVPYTRERIDTDDGDFLDLDWSGTGQSKKLVVFSHGLEGSSRAKYIQGMLPQFLERKYDGLAWNCRTCGGEMNRTNRFYHSGASYDLATVLNHVFTKRAYDQIFLVGFSMGGNITLRYLGEAGDKADPRIKKAVVFSVPLDLKSSTDRMTDFMGRIYTRKFVRTLNKKLLLKKSELEKIGVDIRGAHRIWDFKTWDGRFTAPLHGYASADDYYAQCSSRPVLKNIHVPTLIVNAKNDPFLGQDCFPFQELKNHPFVQLQAPERGGHVGFQQGSEYISERIALDFIEKD